MLSSLLKMDFRSVIITVIAVILSMSIHEMAHGLVSMWLGDPTARRAGRLSLNPFKHIDWAGLLCLLLFGFGWAKPVPVDPSYYKDPKTGMIWTAFAGPVANFLLSFVCVFFFEVIAIFTGSFASSSAGSFILSTLVSTASLSCGFGIFNLLPIPPLDGAKIFWAFLPKQEYFRFNRGNTWMTLIFILLICTGILSSPMSMLRNAMIGWMEKASLWILSLAF